MRAGTIVASNYVEMAKVLGESFLRHHPGDTFVILVVDDEPVDVVPEGIEIQRIADLDLTPATLDLMRTIYDVMEFSTAVKPSFLRGLVSDDDTAVYLDPDIFVYSGFGDLIEPVREHGIVLTPHVLEPIPRDGCDPTEGTIMRSGIFNLGFIGVGRSAVPFLDWWQERLVFDAVVDVERGLFTDQRWIDWVPALFNFAKCTDRGMNIAWWNIHERDVRVPDDEAGATCAPTSDGVPIRFVHFSGYDPYQPDVFSKHQHPRPRTAHTEGIGIRVLAEVYGKLLVERGHTTRRAHSYPWANGSEATGSLPLDRFVRGLVRSAALDEHEAGVEPEAMKTPFAFGDSASELRPWLEAVDGGTDEWPVSRIERQLWTSRPDLRIAFPDIDTQPHAGNFRIWIRREPDARNVLGNLTPALPYDVTPPAQPTPVTVPELPPTLYRRARTIAGRVKRGVTTRLAR